MALRGLFWLLLFQFLGTALNTLFLPALPGPIIGLLLLFAFLALRGRVSEDLSEATAGLLKYLPLLLVPPAVGIMVHVDTLLNDFWAISVSLVGSLLVGIPLTGWLMQVLIKRQQRREGEQ